MKKAFSIITLSLLISCSDSYKTKSVMTNAKSTDTTNNDLWTSINLKVWDKTPAINGRLATETDVKNGLAVYYINHKGADHTPYKIELPNTL